MGVYVPEIPGIKNLGGYSKGLNNKFEPRNVGSMAESPQEALTCCDT